MANIECKCEPNFTCGYCLRNAKPYFFTPDTRKAAAALLGADVEQSIFEDAQRMSTLAAWPTLWLHLGRLVDSKGHVENRNWPVFSRLSSAQVWGKWAGVNVAGIWQVQP
jgi:hypothetical protein